MKLQPGPDDRGLRLDVFLARNLENLTRSQIQLLNRSGAVRIEGRQDKAGYKIRGGTLVHGLLFHFQNLSDVGGKSRPGIVHRLDKWTSGLIIVAKNNVAHARLSRAFQDRQIQKSYLALVHGRPRLDSGTIELSIGRQ